MLWNTTWMEQKVWNPKNQLTPQVLFCADKKPAWGSVCVRSVVHSQFQVPPEMFSEMFHFWPECFSRKNEYGHQAKFQPPVFDCFGRLCIGNTQERKRGTIAKCWKLRFDCVTGSVILDPRLAFKIASAKQIALKKVAKTVVNELIYLLFLLRSLKEWCPKTNETPSRLISLGLSAESVITTLALELQGQK